MSSGTLTLGALGAGVLLGLFLGERAAALDVLADIYIRLLQMTVLPFIVISTIAEITFYGHDQTGREVITTGRISVHFANFGDPE